MRASILSMALLVSAGCSAKLETGYEPRKLGSSTEARRGFYAQPFSPEAMEAKQYEQDFGNPVPPGSRVGPQD